jgi:hypothetical protein
MVVASRSRSTRMCNNIASSSLRNQAHQRSRLPFSTASLPTLLSIRIGSTSEPLIHVLSPNTYMPCGPIKGHVYDPLPSHGVPQQTGHSNGFFAYADASRCFPVESGPKYPPQDSRLGPLLFPQFFGAWMNKTLFYSDSRAHESSTR